ncbi:hypothetical protein SAMN05216252_102219 [Actinacidiphila glaucinigra]|uniref:Tyr recombinase domain-containing protein n=1 Tax=Actinacidiphila glaucinigra TaxID=235986 RepID=A0A239AWR2_9ACTN|nr:hypothetical protein SAMN05216252_102219 [Actinacidiphila glaucinigra]
MEPRNVYRFFTRVAAQSGLRVVRLHDARHGCATLLTAASVVPRVTIDVYTHVAYDTQREAISHMDPLPKRRLPGA